jgi:hypothetical protein
VDFKRLFGNDPHYKGFVSMQQDPYLLPVLKNNDYMIFNTDIPSGSGIHWTALYNRDGTLIYFDSFGVPIYDQLKEYFERIPHKNIIMNEYPYQDMRSNACGHFVIYFLDNMRRRKSFESFLNEFSPKYSSKNEDKLMKIFNEEYN